MSQLSRKVLEEIERRGLEPRSPLYFLARRSVFWLLAGLAVLCGSLSVAFLVFFFTDVFETGGRGFDEMPFDDLAPAVPIVTALLFALFALSASLSLRRTRHGYLRRPSRVIAAAAAASLAAGILLHAANAGSAVHAFLSAVVPGYREYTTVPYEEWSHPELGRLGGEAVSVSDGTLLLKAFDGKLWTVDLSSAKILFEGSPVEEGDVAIRGEQTGSLAFKAREVDEFD
jgi:hypothetical protein